MTPPPHVVTAETADELRTALRATEKFYLQHPQTREIARAYYRWSTEAAFLEYRPLPLPLVHGLNALPYDVRQEILFASQDVAVRRLWDKGKLAYSIDPDAWESIGEADPSTTIPPSTMRTFPHSDPLLIFPEPILLDQGGKERQRVVGMYVNGVRLSDDGSMNGAVVCSSHHPAARGWNLTFAGFVEDDQGRPVMYDGQHRDIMWTRTTIRMEEKTTLGELAWESLHHFEAIQGDLAIGSPEQDLPVLLARAVNMLIYLSAVNADLRPLPPGVPRPRIGRGQARAELEVVEVGYRVGAQLRAWQQSLARQPGPGTGRTIKPHIRRSHDHTFRYGPGRSLSYVKWMWPIPVNMGPEGAQETSIIPIQEKA